MKKLFYLFTLSLLLVAAYSLTSNTTEEAEAEGWAKREYYKNCPRGYRATKGCLRGINIYCNALLDKADCYETSQTWNREPGLKPLRSEAERQRHRDLINSLPVPPDAPLEQQPL